MFKNYLSKNEYQDFEKNLLKRTKIFCKSLIDNLNIEINSSDYDYFYSFILPILIELDYLNYMSSRTFYTRSTETHNKNLIQKTQKKVLKIINNKLQSEKIFSKNEKKNILNNFFDKYNIQNSTIVSFSYFHRHSEYLEEFRKNNKVIELNKDKFRFLENQLNAATKIRKVKFNSINKYEDELITAINFFLNNKDLITFKGKVLLISSHGWVGSNLTRLIISYVSSKTEVPIINLQAGFGHQAMLCFGQVIWERYICDKFITWSEEKFKKDYFLGSMYSFKSLSKNTKNKETLILPQIPRINLPRCFSFYWCLTNKDFLKQLEIFLGEIDNILCKSKSPIFRIKKNDYDLYQKYIFKNFKNVDIDAGDVNKSENFKGTEKTYIFYMSSAIPQAINSGSQTYGIFSNKDTYLNDEYMNLIPDKYPFDCENLSKNLCKDRSIEDYISGLSELIKSICN